MKLTLLALLCSIILAKAEPNDGLNFDPMDSILNSDMPPSEVHHLANSQDPYFSSSEADIVRDL